MDLNLAGKRALVTGGSKGIGRASAAILAEEGCDLLLVARDPAALDTAAPVATERMERLLRHRAQAELGDPARWRELTAAIPYGRPATPEEIGAAVAFLASPRSAYTNGTVLTINGGP